MGFLKDQEHQSRCWSRTRSKPSADRLLKVQAGLQVLKLKNENRKFEISSRALIYNMHGKVGSRLQDSGTPKCRKRTRKNVWELGSHDSASSRHFSHAFYSVRVRFVISHAYYISETLVQARTVSHYNVLTHGTFLSRFLRAERRASTCIRVMKLHFPIHAIL